MSTSTVAPGSRSRTAATAAANWAAPPSGRSSRVTLVITTWRSARRRAASATRRGSSESRAHRPAAPPVSTAQNRQPRVHVSPRMRNVAVPEE
jgi:hypothetical protein